MEISGRSGTKGTGFNLPGMFSCFGGAGLCVFLVSCVKFNSTVGAFDNKIFSSVREDIFVELQRDK